MGGAVEISDVEVFLAVAAQLHCGRAAEQLGIGQPRVSQVVQRLERQLGGRLAERTSRRVTLTPLGERFRDTVPGPLHALQTALLDLRVAAAGIGPVLDLGVIGHSSAGRPVLDEVLAAFAVAHPGCQVHVVEVPLTDPLGGLRRGEVQALCLRQPVHEPDLRAGPTLSEESRVLLVARSSPLAARDGVSWEELGDHAVADVPHLPHGLAQELLPRWTPLGRPVVRGPVVRSMTELLGAVASGSIVHPTARSGSQYRSHPAVVAVPIVDAPPLRSGLVVRSRATGPAALALLEVAARVVAARREADHPTGAADGGG